MQAFLDKIGEKSIDCEVMGAFSEEDWSMWFPQYLQTNGLHISSHEIGDGILKCIILSIKYKLIKRNPDIREELKALSNKYFLESLILVDDAEVLLDLKFDIDYDTYLVTITPTKKFCNEYGIQQKMYSLMDKNITI